LRLIGLERRTWGLLLRELHEVVSIGGVPLPCMEYCSTRCLQFGQIDMYKDLHSDRNRLNT
jgi:hypothetical protein